MIDLNPAHLAIVERILAKHVPECEVRGFGSRATWNAKDHSDLDLAVVGEGPLPRRTLALLKEAFEESRLPMRVDVIDWNAIAEGFRELIASDTVVVQEAPERVEWPAVALSKVAELTLSSVDKKSKPGEHPVLLCNYTDVYNHDFIRAEMDFMSATATEREIGRCSLVEGDVIITKDSEAYDDIGVPALVREHIPNLLCGYHLAILRAKPELDSTYLFYALKTREVQQQFHAYANGVTRYGLRKADIGLVELPLPPPLEEQRAIAHVLSTLDDKIELNRRMSRTLEEMARALFKSWFVDFDPVHAKVNGQPSGLPTDLDALFPGAFETSELGEIPEGWDVKMLEEISHLNPESWSRTNSPDDVEYVDLSNTKWGMIESTQHFLWKDAPSRARRILRSGDTIVGTVRPGNGSYSLIGNDGLTGSTGFAVLRPVHLRFREMVYLSVTAPNNIEWLAHRADGAAYPAVRPEIVSETKVAIPTAETDVLDWFSTAVGTMLNKIEFAKMESRTLAVLRDTLLPKIILGEIRVGHAERVLEAEI